MLIAIELKKKKSMLFFKKKLTLLYFPPPLCTINLDPTYLRKLSCVTLVKSYLGVNSAFPSCNGN